MRGELLVAGALFATALVMRAPTAWAEEEDPFALRQLERRDADRPLTVPRDFFDVYGLAGFAQLTPNDPALILNVGAEYGIDDDLQIGILLLRLALSSYPGTGLDAPIASLEQRLTRGAFELAGRAEVAIPVGGDFQARVVVPMLVRFAGYGRLDFAPAIGVVPGSRFIFPADAQLSMRGQLGDAVSLGAVASLVVPDVSRRDVLLVPGGRLAYAFGKGLGVTFELGLTVLAPAISLLGAKPQDPSITNRTSGTLELRYFVDNPNEDSPLDEDL